MNSAAEEGNLNYAIERLDEWARWLRASSSTHALGYPSAAPFVQQRTSSSFMPAGEPDNDRAEEMERIMCRLREYRPTLYQGLYVWYVARTEDGEQLTLITCARDCSVSVAQYRKLRNQGEMVVFGALMAGGI